MGLDMYLYARDNRQTELGYWRKHPNLHGLIVRDYADGVDECQEIELNKSNIISIMHAIEARALPETTGFFFGVSDKSNEQVAQDLEIFKRALEFMDEELESDDAVIVYQASW